MKLSLVKFKAQIVILFLLLPGVSQADTYYVSSLGNDSNTGKTIADAFKTISRINKIQFFAGDTIRFEGGTSFTGSIVIIPGSQGTASQPIVIMSYGSGRATINASDSIGLYSYNTGGIEVRGINFTGSINNNQRGVYFFTDRTDIALSHIVIEDVEVSGFYDYGVQIGCTSSSKGFSDVLINRVLSHDNKNGGILSSNDGSFSAFNHHNITVTNCKAYNNKGIPGYGNQTGNGILISSAVGALIDHCEAYNNGENNDFNGGGPVGIWFSLVNNGTIQNCESHHNKTRTIDGGGFDLDGGCQNSIIQYCYTHDNQGAGLLLAEYGTGILFTGNTIRYNVSENDGSIDRYGSILVWGADQNSQVTNSKIYNNTVYSNHIAVTLFDANFDNVTISNNIFYCLSGTKYIEGSADSSKIHFIQNDYYSSGTSVFNWNGAYYNSVTAWKSAAVTQERVGSKNYGLSIDPLFSAPGTGRNGYTLQRNSPVIDAGFSMTGIGSNDFYGGLSKVGSSQDIGANEYQSAGSLPPTDTTAPSVPLNLKVFTVSTSLARLAWDNATDNIGVTGYDVFINGVKKYTTVTDSVSVINLKADSSFSAAVRAFDSSGNASALSIPINVKAASNKDTTAPSVPVNLKVVTVTTSFARLAWDNATDNIGVTGYDVFINGVKKYTTVTDSVSVINLKADSSFSVAVRAFDSSGNASALSVPLTVKAASAAVTGLNYRYYEGTWTVLPDFNKLTSIKLGVIPNIDLSVSNVANNYGVVWEGYINIPVSGTYTFETISDDGSKLYFNSLYSASANNLVNNDGLHPSTSVAAAVSIPSAGLYPIAMTFFQAGGGASMQAFWSGPGITRQLIPSSVLFQNPSRDTSAPSVPQNLRVVTANTNQVRIVWDNSVDNTAVTGYDVFINGIKKYTTVTDSIIITNLLADSTFSVAARAVDSSGNASALSAPITVKAAVVALSGLKYRYYEGPWTVLPDFNKLTAIKSGVTGNVDLSVSNVAISYGIVWEGYINMPAPGTYTFETVSDDGSKFYFNSQYVSTATATVNNDGLHSPQSVTATVNVTAAGLYPIAITFFQAGGGASMQAYWSSASIARQLIPNSAFVSQLPLDTIAPSAPVNVTAAFINNTFINLTWNASTDNVGVTGYDVYVNGTKKYTTNTTSVTADSLTAATSYVFTVKAHDFAGNASPLSTAFTSSTTSTATGLTYKYYEGSWTVLPDFSTLTLVKTGITPNVDITVRPAGVINNYALLWQGNLTLPVTGTYTFETISDDGSKLYFNQNYSPAATALVNNDGVHGAISATGSVTMAAGVYPVTITYFQQYSGQSIQVYWSGPGIPRQLIPNTAFTGTYTPAVDTIAPSVPANVKAILTTNTYLDISWDASTDNIGVTGYDVYVNNVKNTTVTSTAYRINGLSAGTSDTITIKAHDLANNISAFSTAIVAVSLPKANGLKYRYYEGTWNVMPNFDTLTAIKTGSSQTPDISIRPSTVNNYFGFVWEGYINITTPGTYTFETISDDGSKFYFNTLYNSAATPLVNNDGLHAPTSVSGGVNIPTAGLYPIAITYFQKDGGAIIQVYYSGPGITRQPIPGTSFSFSGDGTTQAIGSTTNISGSSLTIVNGTVSDAVINAKITRAYPNPFTENLTIQYSNTIPANNVSVAILDMSGKLVQRQILGNTFIGVSTFTINLDKQLKTGIYLVRLDIDGKRFKMWKMVKQNK